LFGTSIIRDMATSTATNTATRTETPAEGVRARLPYGVLLARLGKEAMGRFRKALRPLDVGAQEYVVMKQLEALQTASQADLADSLSIDYSNLATLTGELHDRGLIERLRDPADRRRYVVRLTPSGEALIARADRAIDSGEEDMLRTLDDAERERLWELLGKVADAAELCPRAEADCTESAAAGDPC
jgi:MarR family transcriptional regulator, lower aerobic nicotinate degradation pathway regulator